MRVANWTLDGKPVTIPHVWGEDVDLRWEGPAVYSTTLQATAAGWLVFHGVSARAVVRVNGTIVCDHLGIWDAFSVRLEPGLHNIDVEVTKNGGEAIPVHSIASGFLPFVFGTFGGVYKPVEWFEQEEDPLKTHQAAKPRARFDEHRLFVDDKPVYLRGLLHWGWYPRLRHPAPDLELCKKEIREAKSMGFNCMKFCLWVPPHYYLDELENADMFAWMELPIWNPGENIDQFKNELERIVLQYRHHQSIILWTIGCELGHQMTRDGRRKLYELVKDLTGGALAKDSSGGAEMYGGDPYEFGDFEDFHPYCDLSNYPIALDTLQAGPRKNKAILLGECNDFDSHRDLPRIAKESPYWASDNASLNDQGVRWQFDLPETLRISEWARDESRSRLLMQDSLDMKLFVHRTFQEWTRSRQFSGSVITGIADTPISTSGFYDDWGNPKFNAEEVRKFMSPDIFFLIPQRKLPWIDGGNRPGPWDAWHVLEGPNRIRIGMHSESGFKGIVSWKIGDQSGEANLEVSPLNPHEIIDIEWVAEPNISYTLTVQCPTNGQSWPIECVKKLENSETINLPEPTRLVFAPAFREAAYEFNHPKLAEIFRPKPHTLYAALSSFFLPEDEPGERLMTRVDTRTYKELPVVVRNGGEIISTLRRDNTPVAALVQRALARVLAE